jgi:hypothetical protein
MEFIEKLMTRQDLLSYQADIEKFIGKSGCTKIDFEELSPKCGGISIPGKCIISTTIIQFPMEVLLYILFHEIAHQYQYRKHGRDLMLDAYLSLPIGEAAEELLRIESIADRLAMLKLRSVIGGESLPPYRYYRNASIEYFERHIEKIRKSAEELENRDIDSINEMIYAEYRA